MIFPIGDDNIVGGYKPYVSYGFIALNVLMFVLQMTVPGQLVCDFALVPKDILSGDNYITFVTSIFLHGSIMHLLGNLLYLWIFADNIEATIGHFRFFVFYMLGGFVASAAHIYLGDSGEAFMGCCDVCDLINPCNTQGKPCPGSIPSLGASGAISAVMGAYLVMFPKSRIKMLFVLFFQRFYIPAFIFLLFWFGQQIVSTLGIFNPAGSPSGVAWWAHIGGFVFGLLGGYYFKMKLDRQNTNTYDNQDYV